MGEAVQIRCVKDGCPDPSVITMSPGGARISVGPGAFVKCSGCGSVLVEVKRDARGPVVIRSTR